MKAAIAARSWSGIGTLAVHNIIRERKPHLLYNVIQTSSDVGMRLMDESLKELYESGVITYEQALMRATNPDYVQASTSLGSEGAAGGSRPPRRSPR